MRAFLHHNDLVNDKILLRLLLQIHLLDGDKSVGATFVSSKHAARSTLTDLGEAPEDLARIAIVAYPLQRLDNIHIAALSRTLSMPGLGTNARGARSTRGTRLLLLLRARGSVGILGPVVPLSEMGSRMRLLLVMSFASGPTNLTRHGSLRLSKCLFLLLLHKLLLVGIGLSRSGLLMGLAVR